MNYNKDNSCYLCHKCLHSFFLKSDIQRHLDKKEPCESKYNCLLSNEDIKEKSLSKRYYFYNDIRPCDLEIYQKIVLVNKYNLKFNVISELSSNKEDDNKTETKSENVKLLKSVDDCIVIINDKKRYRCALCNTDYKNKNTLIQHFSNKDLCDKKKAINKTLENINNELLNNIQQSIQQSIQQPIQQTIQNINNNQFIQNNNNNIQNIQNINNNLAQNNYNVQLKDFVENNYSHKHIPRNAIENKDFYLHKNFLNLIMENDENKNIYFDGKYAFVYTDGGLKRIQSDKAGYLVLEKLDKAMISYVYSNPQSLKEDFSYVDRYYSVMKNKYIFDTIHRSYDVETRKFDYCETKNIRTRDKCLSEITQICNLYKDRTKEIMKSKDCDKYEIDTNYQVNIPNYESSRKRNKAFIDNGKYY
jgi:hypothetical protein